MAAKGWKRLLDGAPWFEGEGAYPIEAYSEFMPPPRFGPKPYGTWGVNPLPADDPFGWKVTEYEEAFELRPGLEALAHGAVHAMVHLSKGDPAHGISRGKLANNPYWPPELVEAAGKLAHERYVLLMSLALSRTQDDKGRVRWTLFGGSEQGPSRAFWKSFYTAPNRETPEEQGIDFFRRLLAAAHGEEVRDAKHLHQVGFRILPATDDDATAWPAGEPLPRWTARYLWKPRQSVKGVKYLLTFRPFRDLPAAVRRAYLAGELHLLPFPGSLVFWGTPMYVRMRRELPYALQIPLQHLFPRHEDVHGMRGPQSGWLHEPRPEHPESDTRHGPFRNTYKRAHRWQRMHRHEDQLEVVKKEDKVARVLFSTDGKNLGLYDKPMARNAELWTAEGDLLLDGPRATPEEIAEADRAVHAGGSFGYRFLFPPMRVGRYEVFWHRPLAAYRSVETGEPAVVPGAPLGYLTAYRADKPDLTKPVELWPRLLHREGHVETVELFTHTHDEFPHQTSRNVRKLLDVREGMGRPLPPAFARCLLRVPKDETLDQFVSSLVHKANEAERGRRLVQKLRDEVIDSSEQPPADPNDSLTYRHTAKRAFEVEYWKTICFLAHGQYRTKNNADCVQDEPTLGALAHHRRDLDDLGNYLLNYYDELIGKHGLRGKALAAELPFRWSTSYPFKWMGGWAKNQEGAAEERDIVAVIPGRDRKRAVIMADHYDTAFMADCYDPEYGGWGARLAAAGADDNHSATAALMLAAPIFLEMSRAGRLGCDVWLIHLTGEEFPADCLGARALTQRLVEGTLKLHLPDDGWKNLSRVRVQGLYVLDMVAHNNDHERDIFQMAPGASRESLWLAYQSHLATQAWNAGAAAWNRRPGRKGRGRGRRSADGKTVPAVALHPHLDGQVRIPYDPRSTLYNTDGQIFSDAGVPCVLFMENYDINRTGYHDTHDTMENIYLDYGAAVTAIAIESVARAATQKPDFV
jgi:hypothetical protein